ncbi:MAG: flavodoxin family protein [Candidatus Humimicrobiaceae bacterium]
MKVLVVFDSNLGNTKIIAETIAKELGNDTKSVSVSDFDIKDLKGIGLIIAGSPIIAWKPTEKMDKFLSGLSKDQLMGIKAASFDTRVKIFHGDAAKKISQKLAEAGAEIVGKPQAFFVRGKEGPLFDGEIEKAVEWAKSIITRFK